MCIDGGESIRQNEELYRFNYHKGKYVEANNLIEAIDWKRELSGNDLEGMWSTFLRLYNSIVNQCVPLYALNKGKRKKKWMNLQLLKIIKKKENAWRRYRNNVK